MADRLAEHALGDMRAEKAAANSTALSFCPADVAFENPLWQPALSKLVVAILEKMGCDESIVDVTLGGLILHKPGQHYKSPTYPEKAPGTFGTLEIQLPGYVEGRVVTVKHQGHNKTYDHSGRLSASRWVYRAFYCDCAHEASLTPAAAGAMPLLMEALKMWERQSKQLDKLLWHVHVLEHQYSADELTMDGLKGPDAIVGALIAAAVNDAVVVAHLAQLTREETWRDPNPAVCLWDVPPFRVDEKIVKWELQRESNTLKSFVRVPTVEAKESRVETTTDGCVTEGHLGSVERECTYGELQLRRLEVENSALLREADATRGKPTDKLKPYTLSESGCGVTRDRTYHRSAVIFWPASHHLQLMLEWGAKEYAVAKLEAAVDAPVTLPCGVTCRKTWCEALLQHLQRDPDSEFGDFYYRRMRYVKVGARAGADVQLLLELLQGVDIVRIHTGTAYRGADERAEFLETLKALEKRGELKCTVPYLCSSFEASGRKHRGHDILSSAQSIMEACPSLEVVQSAVHAAAVMAYKRTASFLSWCEVVEAMKNMRRIGGNEDDVLEIMRAVRMFHMAAEQLQEVLEAAAAALGSYTSLIPIVGRCFKSVDARALRVLEKLTDVTRGLDALAQLNDEIADHLVDRFMKSNGKAVEETDLVDFYVGLLVARTDTAALTLIDRVIGAGPRRFNQHYLLHVMQLLQNQDQRAEYPGLDRLVLHTVSPYVMSSSPGALKVKVSWLLALIWAAEKAQLPAEVMTMCLTTLDASDPFTDELRRALELLPEHAPSVKSHPEFDRLIRRAIDKLRTAAEPKESFAIDYQTSQAQQELKERRSQYANRRSYIKKLEEVLHSLPSAVHKTSPAGSASASTTSAALAAAVDGGGPSAKSAASMVITSGGDTTVCLSPRQEEKDEAELARVAKKLKVSQ